MLAGRMSDATRQFVMETARACFQSPVPTPYSMFHYKREDIRRMTIDIIFHIQPVESSLTLDLCSSPEGSQSSNMSCLSSLTVASILTV